MKDRKLIKAPDGGWGWMACLGSSLIMFSLRALDPSFGLVFHDFLIEMGTDSTRTSFITSVYDANVNFSGLFVGPLLKKFSFRNVAFAGAMLSSIGLIFTSRARSVTHVLCTYSVLSGVGTGLAMAASFVALNNYFDKKRGQAVGFSMVGSAIAMTLMPQLAHGLLDAYAFRGTMLIIGGWAMHSLVGACLLRPLESPRKRKEPLTLKVPKSSTLFGVITNGTNENNAEPNGTVKSSESEQLLKNLINTDDHQRVKQVCTSKNTFFVDEESSKKSKKKLGCFRLTINTISNFLDLELLKDSVYLNVIIGLSLFNVAEVNFKMITPFFLRSIGLTKGEVAFCLSLSAFTDIVARLILPIIYDKLGTSKRRNFWISSMLVGICRSILAERTKGISLMVIVVIIGFFRGAAILNLNLSVSECCSLQKLPHAYGLYMVSKGIFSLTLSPLVGFVRDYSGSYSVCIHGMTVLIFLTFISWSIEFSWKALRQRFNKSNNSNHLESIPIDCPIDTITIDKQKTND